MAHETATTQQSAGDQATRLKKQRDFRGHLITYLLVNAFLVVIWAVTSHGFFWPAFVLGGWGIAVAVNAWEAYGKLGS